VDVPVGDARNALRLFLMDRLQHLMQTRGAGYEEVQTVTGGGVDRVAEISPVDLIEWAAEWRRVVGTPLFESAAEAHKRAKKIVEAEWSSGEPRMSRDEQAGRLTEGAERELRGHLDRVDREIRDALAARQPRKAIEAVASIQPAIGKFFDEVRVVVPDAQLKNARLSLLMDFRDAVSRFGDPSVFAHRQA
jgi:glycyl-tRNA synthetase beta chain